MEQRELYGGAMSMNVPKGMTDVSKFREVPDNQEVFADGTTDASVIIEILERVDEKKHEALRYHFQQVAELNKAATDEKPCIEDIQLSSISEAYVLVSQQAVAKFNETAANQICLLMALLRIPEHTADVLITMNVPLSIHKQSSSFTNNSEDSQRLPAPV
ncbi:ran guanine nucleotide release factor-like protein, partial [Coemansia reversa NRRL 1564]